jgi:enoyl-CoA hydratase/carnithine racemase
MSLVQGQAAPGRLSSLVSGNVGWVVIDNPRRRNAMSFAMWVELSAALEAFESDDTVRCVVLRGAGTEAFSAGADLSEFDAKRSSKEANREYERTTYAGLSRLATLGKPTIAMISGYCIGGGLAIALACDARIAATGSSYAVPAGKLGVGYSGPALRQLAFLVGPAVAKLMLFSAKRMPAEEALRAGLVQTLVAPQALSATVDDLTATIAANAPLSLRAGKAEIDLAYRNADRSEFEAVAEKTRACQGSEDFIEGRRAFEEKRTPRFEGR